MIAHKAFKFSLYPSDDQKVLLARTFGCVCLRLNRPGLIDSGACNHSTFPTKIDNTIVIRYFTKNSAIYLLNFAL